MKTTATLLTLALFFCVLPAGSEESAPTQLPEIRGGASAVLPTPTPTPESPESPEPPADPEPDAAVQPVPSPPGMGGLGAGAGVGVPSPEPPTRSDAEQEIPGPPRDPLGAGAGAQWYSQEEARRSFRPMRDPTLVRPTDPLRGANQWALLIEPAHLRSGKSFPMFGSLGITVLVPALWNDGWLTPIRAEEFDAMDVEWINFLHHARWNTSQLMTELSENILTDENGAETAIRIWSRDPRTAAVLLHPDFLRVFATRIDGSPFIVMPSMNEIFLFQPERAIVEKMIPVLRVAHKRSPWPASMEIFRITDKGIEAVGVIDPD